MYGQEGGTVGSISGGRLSFTAPSTVDGAYLMPLWEGMLPAGLTISPVAARIAVLSLYFDEPYYLDMTNTVEISFGNITKNSNAFTSYEIHYWYADRPATIKGSTLPIYIYGGDGGGATASQRSGDAGYPVRYDITLQPGWNRVYVLHKANYNNQSYDYVEVSYSTDGSGFTGVGLQWTINWDRIFESDG